MNKISFIRKTTVMALVTCTSLYSKPIKEERSFNLRVGDKFEISLPANPSTGYVWSMLVNQPPEKRFIELIESNYNANTKNVTGSGGTITFTFKAINPTNLASFGVPLYYCRPSTGSIEKILSLVLTIKNS